ncbi:hypothetical protein [Nocardioides caldifontis]|uniref:hypothetical protein n=1 Tax=Nocardioides caldifontis TaxID=2588938 RepID=UPI0011DFB0FD|nr:hypothetical protein [Nocardioides caldifontis]
MLLHVGAPKTGTSFVQDLLFQNRERLAAEGVLYPAERFDAHFLAALDLMQLPWGGLEQQAVGAWDRLAEQVRAWPGTVIISHEILATASKDNARRAVESFGPDAEVHVIASVRDLVRQIPAEWQENVKHRRTLRYQQFLRQIMDPTATGTIPTWFWGVQDIPAILDRWGGDLPPQQVHVVTVPRPGAPPTLLWERFASVFGLDPAAYDTESVQRANPSLGVAETAMVRRLNQRVNGRLANEHYREFVRELLAHRTLSRRPGKVPLRLPDEVRSWAVDLSESWIRDLAAREYDVVGSLDDLRPEPEHLPFSDPDRPPHRLVADSALHSLEALLIRTAELRTETDELHRRIRELEVERDIARSEIGWSLKARRRVIAKADERGWSRAVLRGYRAVKRVVRR